MSRYLDSNRLRSVYLDQARFAENILPDVLKATLALSTSQTSQMVLQVVDTELALLAGNFAPKRTAVTYAKLQLEVAVRETILAGTSTPALQLTARARGIQRLKRATGAHAWKGISPTTWLREQARLVGMGFVGQPSAVRTSIVRKHDKGSPAESSWDTATRLASELGFECFEASGVVYFAQPTWLAKHLPVVTLRWHGSGSTKTDPGLLTVPQIRDSDDDTGAGYTGTLSVTPDLAEALAPGLCVINLQGMGPYSTHYLTTDVALDLDGVTAGSVSIATPVNPVPQPDTGSDTGSSGASGSGSSGAGVDKYGNATGPKYVPTPVYKPDQKPSSSRPYHAPGSKVGAI